MISIEELRKDPQKFAKGAKDKGIEINIQEDVEKRLQDLLWSIPNPAKSDVKVGKDDYENEIVRKEGTPRPFSFSVRDHMELGEMLDIIDVKRAAKVSGARFYYLKNEGALLEQALVKFAFDTLVAKGFIPIIP